jgi:hypothetical protein
MRNAPTLPHRVTYFWDFEFQGRFEVDVPDDQKPFLALAGSILHGDFMRNWPLASQSRRRMS